MKTPTHYIYNSVVCLLLLGGCTSPPLHDHVAILKDVTDTHLVQPDTHAIRSMLTLTTDRWAGAKVSVAPITDVGYNARHELSIRSSSSFTGNLTARNIEVREFWHQFELAWGILKDSTGREHTSVYRSLVRELEHLSSSQAINRTLLVYSDLGENSEIFSVHSRKDWKLLEEEPDSVMRRLSREHPLPESMDGITVWFIHQPTTPDDDVRFSRMSALFSSAFTQQGATVKIGGTPHVTQF